MIKKLIIASLAIFILQRGISAWASATKECIGWNCEEVECKNGYAVRLPDGSYLPCEKFDAYVNGDKSVVIK